MPFIAEKSRGKCFGFVFYSHFKDGASIAIKKNAKFQTRYVKGEPLVNRRYLKGDLPFFSKLYMKG